MSVPKPAVSGIFQAEKYSYYIVGRKILSEPTLFRKYYERGDLPVAVSFNGALRKVTKIDNLVNMENGTITFRLPFTFAYFLLRN